MVTSPINRITPSLPDERLALHDAAQAAQWLRERVTGRLQADSRQVRVGDGFIAWPGAATDGRRYVANAIAQGATACLVEQDGLADWPLPADGVAAYPQLKAATGPIAAAFYDHPSQSLALLAVTGTNGKTSTTWWLAQALRNLGEQTAKPSGTPPGGLCAVMGTLGIGVPPHLVFNGLTTPDPVTLQHHLRDFVAQGIQACAIEASSIGLAEHRLDGCAIRVAVFTNFSHDHLDYHGSMEAYWQAKAGLFRWPGLQAAVINQDDLQGSALALQLAETRPTVAVWTTCAGTANAQEGVHAARLQALNIRYAAHAAGYGLCFEVQERAAVEVLDAYKASTGKTVAQTPKVDVAAAAQAAIAKAQSAPPMSLSEIPAGANVMHDEAAAIMEMSEGRMLQKFMNSPNAMELMNRLM